jgi:D-beta-D-heptose 7-phosphate kinase/D-beta-D-heptose 1-phosphate adenosyltransferase
MPDEKKTVALSGGCDPVHVGIVRMIDDAAQYGRIIFILNSNEWLRRKKGYVFMPWEQRAEILRAFRNISEVVAVSDLEGTVVEALRKIKPDYFGNGGDRSVENTPEVAVCNELGIEMLWNLGGSKIQSSSELVDAAVEHMFRRLMDCWRDGR